MHSSLLSPRIYHLRAAKTFLDPNIWIESSLSFFLACSCFPVLFSVFSFFHFSIFRVFALTFFRVRPRGAVSIYLNGLNSFSRLKTRNEKAKKCAVEAVVQSGELELSLVAGSSVMVGSCGPVGESRRGGVPVSSDLPRTAPPPASRSGGLPGLTSPPPPGAHRQADRAHRRASVSAGRVE